jgi:hypothetical protein
MNLVILIILLCHNITEENPFLESVRKLIGNFIFLQTVDSIGEVGVGVRVLLLGKFIYGKAVGCFAVAF